MSQPNGAGKAQEKPAEKPEREGAWLTRYFAQPTNLRAVQSMIPKAASGLLTPERFARYFVTAITQTPGLLECSQESLINCALDSAALGLVPNTPLQQAALVPYEIKEKKHAKFMVMKRGWIDLVLRAGSVSAVQALAVFEGDHFVWREGPDGEVVHEPELEKDPGKVRCAYAWARLKDGTTVRRLYRKHQIDIARDRALEKLKDWQVENSPWILHYDRMAEKYSVKHFIQNTLLLDEVVEKAFEVDERESVTAGPTIDVEVRPHEVRGAPAQPATPPPEPPPAEHDGPRPRDFWEAVQRSDLPKEEALNVLAEAAGGVRDPKLAGPEGLKRAIAELNRAAEQLANNKASKAAQQGGAS